MNAMEMKQWNGIMRCAVREAGSLPDREDATSYHFSLVKLIACATSLSPSSTFIPVKDEFMTDLVEERKCHSIQLGQSNFASQLPQLLDKKLLPHLMSCFFHTTRKELFSHPWNVLLFLSG